MTVDKEKKRLQQKHRREQKRQGTYVDLRYKSKFEKKEKTKPQEKEIPREKLTMLVKNRNKFAVWREQWQFYIHHISRCQWDDYDLACSCIDPARGQSSLHMHYLRFVSQEEINLQKHGNLRRGLKKTLIGEKVACRRGTRDTRVKIKCIGHFINVVHYVSCRRSQSKSHKHQDHMTNIGPWPTCDGTYCSEYKDYLQLAIGIEHDQETCTNCQENMKRFKRAYALKMQKARKNKCC